MKMLRLVGLLIISSLFLGACSDASSKSDQSSNKDVVSTSQSKEIKENRADKKESTAEQDNKKPKAQAGAVRKVIYTGQLHLVVKNFEKAQTTLEEKANKYGGYIVESNVFRDESKQLSGMIILRIPEQHFRTFLTDAEGTATKVLERSISGQDVTEEYVDLESRLKSKRAVEERLNEFMKKAERTEDLLKISSDLSKVQEEIEALIGRMEYLKNQTSLSTVTITIDENKVVIPDLDQSNLNTWQKTKKQFIQSVNFLASATSGLVVFIVGNLPIILMIILIATPLWIVIRKKMKSNDQESR